jgi:hypothetical protein
MPVYFGAWDDYEGYEHDSDNDGPEGVHRDGSEQLDFAWVDLLQTHGYEPNDRRTKEHLIEYWLSVWQICEGM